MDSDALMSLKAQVRGPVIQAEDPAFDEARAVYNAMIDCRPEMVVRARDEADAMVVLEYVRNTGMPLAVRGGGHSVPGYGTCDGGIVLDLSLLRNVRVDPDRRVARVGGGALLGDLDHATHAFGLATPAGFNSS